MNDEIQYVIRENGRKLAFREYGDPKGVPCLYTTGTPASGYAGKMMDEAGKEAGVRWISLDKPGYGYSDFQPGRTLLQWPADVAAVADYLGIERFAAAGESGGGPHVLAVAYALPQRVTTAIVLAGMGPGDDPKVVEGMKPTNKILFTLALRAPWLLKFPISRMGKAISDPVKAEKFMKKQLAATPQADRDVFLNDPTYAPIGMQASAESFLNGPDGAIQEMQIFAKPWGFRIEDIKTHVDLFHGEQDVNVPVVIARQIVARLTDCDARIRPEFGHAISFPLRKDVMQCVLDAA